jgi:outer membrane protein assembly factor BamE
MRFDIASKNIFSVRAPLVAMLVGALLTMSGCALWRGSPSAPQSILPAVPVSATGAQTVTASPLQKFLWILSPYRPDIQQGNFVSQEMLEQLKVGQTREQVRFVLGTPLLTDIFHANRWDYPFYLARGDGEMTSARVSVFFKDNIVERIEGGNLPTEREYIARIAGPSKAAAKEAPKKEEVGAAKIQINK